MYEVEARIKGIASLLQHRYPEGSDEKAPEPRPGTPDWKAEAETALYCLPDGKIYQPASHIEGALLKASANFQIKGKRKKTYKDLVKSAVFVRPDAIPHLIQKYEIDKRLVVNPSTRGRIVRYRPRLDEWELAFTIEVMEDQLSIDVLKNMLDYAGNFVGIGDYRPRFGRFMVTSFQKKE